MLTCHLHATRHESSEARPVPPVSHGNSNFEKIGCRLKLSLMVADAATQTTEISAHLHGRRHPAAFHSQSSLDHSLARPGQTRGSACCNDGVCIGALGTESIHTHPHGSGGACSGCRQSCGTPPRNAGGLARQGSGNQWVEGAQVHCRGHASAAGCDGCGQQVCNA